MCLQWSWRFTDGLCNLQHEPWTRQGSYSVELLASVRQGEHPLAAYETPNLAQPLARSLSRILINCHTLFGSYRLFNAGRCVPLTQSCRRDSIPVCMHDTLAFSSWLLITKATSCLAFPRKEGMHGLEA